MSRRVLFLVSGLGLGNSTRCFAIIERLALEGAEVAVATSDNGLWFFSDKPQVRHVSAIPSLHYGKQAGRISVARTLAGLSDHYRCLVEAERAIAAIIDRLRPQVVVTDSVYAVRAVRRAGLPLVAVNNADMVMTGLRRFRDWPLSVLPQGLLVEGGDAAFHRLVPDLVISPRLVPTVPQQVGHLCPVAPIVRRACHPGADLAGPARRVAIMLSGSVFGTPVHLSRRHPGLDIDILGRPAPAGKAAVDGVTYHGKQRDSLALLRQADLLVINGGYSAVAEALALAKPVVVVPVPRHAEQWVNGRIIEDLGVGLMASEDGLEDAMDAALRDLDRWRQAFARLPPAADGAAAAARLILAAGSHR
jgi:UDP:flavonoid glycosyltransferase YjiC (YdhE family)